MTTTSDAVMIDPVEVVGQEFRLFIDTNVFMDTDPRRDGGLKGLFRRIAPIIQQGGSPIIVPTKVSDELRKNSRTDTNGLINTTGLDPDGVTAAKKAANALSFIEAAHAAGLVRNDLGDESNPYADDLFVDLFTTYSTRFAMCLITNDITLLMRINLLGRKTANPVLAGRLTGDGLLEREDPQALYERGLKKLARISARLEAGPSARKDQLEVTSLSAVLNEYSAAFGTEAPSHTQRRPQPVATSHPGAARPRSSGPAPFNATADFKGPDEVLSVGNLPEEGDQVRVISPSGSVEHTLGSKRGEGGEGSVYEISDSQVIKIFDADHITKHREEKIKLLVSRGFNEPGICFPQGFVTNLDGEFVGYVMPQAKGREFSKVLFKPRRFKVEHPGWQKSDLVEIAISFLEKVSYLHSKNVLLGDINPKNVLVDSNKDVWIIDADSWQLEGYPCPVGTDMYSAPAIIGKHYPDFLRTPEDERYAVATMLFMILITGLFPYARSGSDGDTVKLISEGSFALQYKENSNQDQPAGNWKFMWSHLQPGLKALFWNTFHRNGDRYSSRPTDLEWLAAFREYRRYLGSSANFDPMSNDVYPTRFKAMSPDTPLYECAGCKTSMVGIYNDKTKTYTTHKYCRDCSDERLPKCADCGRSKPSLKDGRCYDCNRKRNFSACVGCGREKPVRSLVDGRCYDCNQGSCSSCGRTVLKRYLIGGRCDRCQLVACNDCSTGVPKSSLSYGRCPRCQARHEAEWAAKKQRRDTLDPNRLCVRCGKPFITYGNVDWHQRNSRDVPTSHKWNDPSCPSPSTKSTSTRSTYSHKIATPSGTAKSQNSGGCFVATAVYGSYDCPEVWVLRRWRDASLQTSRAGRALVRFYYSTSPRLVALVGDKPWFTRPGRRVLNRLVHRLKETGLSDSPYNDQPQSDIVRSSTTEASGEAPWQS